MDECLALLLRDRRDVVFRDELDAKGVERGVDTSRRDADLEGQRHRADDHAVHRKVSCNRRPEGLDFRLWREHCASQPSHVLKGASASKPHITSLSKRTYRGKLRPPVPEEKRN